MLFCTNHHNFNKNYISSNLFKIFLYYINLLYFNKYSHLVMRILLNGKILAYHAQSSGLIPSTTKRVNQSFRKL